MSEERIKCINRQCEIMILPSTVSRYGGLCGGCSLKKDQAERAEFIRKNRHTVDLYEGVTDPVEIIRILHSPKKYDELIRYSAPPEAVNVLYEMLDESQQRAIADFAIAAMRTGDKRFAGRVGESLATLTDFSLDEMLEASLDLWRLWPPIVFRNAGSAVREHIIASMQDEGADINRALFALAWIGDESVIRRFLEWRMHPSSWVAKLHVEPAAYAHVAGWEVTEFGRRNLYYDTCFGISVAEPSEGCNSVCTVREVTERCPWCNSKLVHLVELDLRDPQFDFLECSGEILPVLTCEHCTGFTSHVFARIDADGIAKQHECNVPPQWLPDNIPDSELGPWHAKPVKLKPRSAIQAAIWTMELAASQIGGHPTWVQDSEYPICPDCSKTMRFIAQLDNGAFPLYEGIYYAFLCSDCRITATTYQQT